MRTPQYIAAWHSLLHLAACATLLHHRSACGRALPDVAALSTEMPPAWQQLPAGLPARWGLQVAGQASMHNLQGAVLSFQSTSGRLALSLDRACNMRRVSEVFAWSRNLPCHRGRCGHQREGTQSSGLGDTRARMCAARSPASAHTPGRSRIPALGMRAPQSLLHTGSCTSLFNMGICTVNDCSTSGPTCKAWV